MCIASPVNPPPPPHLAIQGGDEMVEIPNIPRYSWD